MPGPCCFSAQPLSFPYVSRPWLLRCMSLVGWLAAPTASPRTPPDNDPDFDNALKAPDCRVSELKDQTHAGKGSLCHLHPPRQIPLRLPSLLLMPAPAPVHAPPPGPTHTPTRAAHAIFPSPYCCLRPGPSSASCCPRRRPRHSRHCCRYRNDSRPCITRPLRPLRPSRRRQRLCSTAPSAVLPSA